MRLALLLVATFAFAQEAPKPAPEIRGVVLESGTTQPVVDAEVSLYFLGEARPSIRVGVGMLKAVSLTRTDFAGAFSFKADKPGYYTVAVKKEGYSAPTGGGVQQQDVTLTADAPSGEARLALSRPGRMTGRVVEEETRRPIAGVRVTARSYMRMNGRRIGMAPGSVTTDADGQFVLPNLPPGDYMAEVNPWRRELLTKFTEDDVDKTDQGLEHTFWPGGHGEDSAIPVALHSGATVDIGILPVKKTTYYRLHVHMPPSVCGAGDTMMVYEHVPMSMITISDKAACRDEMLITGFPPGSYALILAVNSKAPAERAMAHIPFVIADESVEITAPLERGVVLDVALAAAEGAKAPEYSGIAVAVRPVDMIPFANVVMPVKLDAKGGVRISGVQTGPVDIDVMGLSKGYYVKEIQYNGIPAATRRVQLEKSAMAHSITVVVDDKPATITGAVTKDDKPVSKPSVILVKWPLPDGEPFMPTAIAPGDDTGKFQAAGLAPGEYRAVAVASQQEYFNREPNTLERALAEAKKIEVGRGAFVNVTLELKELR
ncbi:MAG: carboxypeptidase-like regulatory domain-containing protein [Acidobacteriia bacterium]|nr:carboxypeptidase-like regulatory domain-containing protein [Terriglobia bacterium]